MPKLKTRKAAKKRFRFTGKGRIKRSKSGKRHILTKKSRKRKRGEWEQGKNEKEETRKRKGGRTHNGIENGQREPQEC